MRELFIRKLIKMVEQSDIESLEVKSWGRTVRIFKTRAATNGDSVPVTAAVPVARAMAAPVATAIPVPAATASEQVQAAPTESKSTDHEIKSPMVGTFYTAPSPDAKPFVEVGDTVKAGQTVCIVEAMKLMNEIQSDVAGTVSAITAENGQPVEYGQVMFTIKPA